VSDVRDSGHLGSTGGDVGTGYPTSAPTGAGTAGAGLTTPTGYGVGTTGSGSEYIDDDPFVEPSTTYGTGGVR
jgi:hypothetical protein